MSDSTFVGQSAGQFNGSGLGTISITNAGSGYTDGTYNNVTMRNTNTAFIAYNMLLNLVVSGGVVTTATVTGSGSGVVPFDTIQIDPNFAPAGLQTGSGFVATVNTITSNQGNTAIGRQALAQNPWGSRNTAIGYRAGFNSFNNDSVYIGYQAGQSQTQAHRLAIGNQSGDLITGQFAGSGNAKVRVNGALEVNDTYIQRSGERLVIKRNEAASTNAIQVDFDPSGAASNSVTVNGTFILTASGPATSTGGGNRGQLGFDNDYIYVCVAGGPPGSATWKRVALEAF
jgi:hypothetical protein